MPVAPDDLRIHFKGSLAVSDDPFESYVEHEARITLYADGKEVEVGELTFTTVPVMYTGDEEGDAENFDFMDSITQETCDLHAAIQTHLCKDGGFQLTNLVLVSAIRVKPEHQRQGIATLVLRRLLEHWGEHGGNPSHAFLRAWPFTQTDAERRTWQERDPSGHRKEVERLRRLYARIGFQSVGDSDFLSFHLERRLPDLPPLAAT